ncbi:UPF0149 family protein [Rhodocyclus gracilis]|uniref:UPF0149 family protein n=1 Tax=Rhodocyclus tenuis TaxID=1066 RepID=A0A6L5JSR2_RHOTE|nr:UPF0149 family protein [Rhodocyclus gracilis]MQY50425.1 UPF0149 family protein [Rhodocyclus gracilis]
MSATPPLNPLGDADFDRLEALLEDPSLPEPMSLDEVQGYLCAVLSGPEQLPEAQRLAEILGSDDALDTNVGREAAELLRRYTAQLEAGLAAGEAPTLLLYARDGEEAAPNDFAPWCEAYLFGVDASPEDWFEALEAEADAGGAEGEEASDELDYLDERLFPMMLLTGEAETAAREHGEEWPQGEELESIERECEERLPYAVVDIYRFWLAKRGIATVRRDDPKVGRNDPCPCGSGKKFKQCCGAAE